MSVFKNRVLIKIIASICLFFTVFNFSGISKVYAKGDDDLGWGGVLINPITSLMTAIGDAIMDILHDAIREQDTSIVKISGDTNWAAFWKTVAVVVVAIVAAVLFVLATAATAGLADAALGVLAGGTFAFSMGSVGAGTVIGGAVVGICVGIRAGDAWFPDDIYLPVFTISAEEIFANQVPLFDVNFFNPMDSQEINKYGEPIVKEVELYSAGERYDLAAMTNNPNWRGISLIPYNNQEFELTEETLQKDGIKDVIDKANASGKINSITANSNYKLTITAETKTTQQGSNVADTKVEDTAILTIKNAEGETVEELKYVKNITAGRSGGAVTEKISAVTTTTPIIETITINSTASQLQGVISTWYFILRNIALLVLMLLLIYSGIRIVIGSTAGEKAKYKERIMDWLVAICLVMIMHYIMVFAVELVEQITGLIRDFGNKNTNAAYIPLSNNQWNNASEMDWTEFGGQENLFVDDSEAESGKALVWQTDLVGLFRIQAQFENEGTAKWVGYSFCYVVLVLFTLFFAFTYVKRILYMAFLTIIAPLVAMTYPIDKITDGKAQAFDAWLKEYIFNLMIQPLHLLLYTMLVTSAFQLASENAIYALVAIGFMMPAEKLMRRFFGFEKAKTPGLLGGAAGAAIAMSGLQGLLKHKPNGGKSDGGKGKSGDENKVRFSNKNKGNAMDDMTGMKPAAGENAAPKTNDSQNINNQDAGADSDVDKQEWDSRLTQEQKDEMMAEGISPGDAEYDGYLKQYGLDSSADDIDEDDILANTTLGSEDWDHDGFGSENVGEGPDVSKVEATGDSGVEATTDSENGSEKEHKHSIMRAIGVATLGVGKQAAAGVLRGAHPLRFAGKVAAGATAATAGLLIGTASGDPNKAFQYTTGGAMAGSAFANSLSGRKGLDTEKIKQEYEMAYYGPDYKEKLIERQKKEFQASSENINYLRQVMGVSHSEAKQILESTGGRCFDNGITDIKDVATIHKLMYPNGTKRQMEFEKASAARTYAKRRLGGADASQMTDEQVREYQARWAKEFQERYKITDKQAGDLARKAFDAAVDYNKKYSDLTKG